MTVSIHTAFIHLRSTHSNPLRSQSTTKTVSIHSKASYKSTSDTPLKQLDGIVHEIRTQKVVSTAARDNVDNDGVGASHEGTARNSKVVHLVESAPCTTGDT